VFYADLECPYCKDYSPQLRRWIDTQKDVNLQWHHLPLNIHEPAASQAAHWVYDYTRSDGHGVPDWGAFPGTNAALKACAASEEIVAIVQTQADEALASGITATPSLRLMDNASGQSIMLPGQVPGDVLLSAIDLLAMQDQK